MKKLMLCAVAAIIAVIAPLAMRAENPNKILIAYFSWGGNTQTVAEYIAEQTQGELFRIEPVVPYPTEYTPCTEVALEERDSNARPAIKDQVVNWNDYDIIFIGCPVWWHEAPMIIHTFAESYNFEGKTVVPFCTYAATYRDETLAKIVEITPAANHLEGYGVSGRSTRGVAEWLDEIGMIPSEESVAEAIDLGLSVKWASFNIGASKPEEYGGLYGWGDSSGEITSENLDDYPSVTPPASICGTQYDIATSTWGSDWRMPTQAEFEELASDCTWEWSELNGINGMKITGINGNSIFLPAGAHRTGDSVSNQIGQRGSYWSGTLWADNSNFASYLYFYSDANRVQPARSNRRYIGMSVRAVQNEANSGIENIVNTEHNFDIDINGNQLHLTNLESGASVFVYDVMGNLIYSGSNHSIAVGGHGIYILRVNNQSLKIKI